MTPDRDVVAEGTVALRAEVREALAAWQADINNYELELDYFDKMDRLDINLAERGLERGEDIDEELPLRDFHTQEDRMSPSPKWEAAQSQDGGTEYHFIDSNLDATVWKDHGHWKVAFSLDAASPWIHADLGRTRSVDKALNRAELTIMSAQVEVHQSYEDVRNVVNLAKEVEDRTPAEQASLDRLQESIDQGPPPGAVDPAEDWLEVFDGEMEEREKGNDQDQGRDA
jgi:hypothetical protein